MPVLFPRIYLIEDDSSHALLIGRILQKFASTVQTFASFHEFASSESILPDLIVSDLNLPDKNGDELILALQARSVGVPIVVLTSSTALNDAVDALKAGAKDFIVKDFNDSFSKILALSLERVRANQALEAERIELQRKMEALRVSIENSGDGLAVLGQNGEFLYANTSFNNFIQTCNKDLTQLPTNITDVFSSRVKNAQGLKDGIAKMLREDATSTVWRTEVTFVEDVESAFDLSLSVIDFASRGGGYANQFVIWLKDVSEQKRRERFQREILSTTTHDLKGPLGAILVSTELLGDDGQFSERSKEIILRIASAAQGAVNLIDEFLSARRIQEGTFILRPREYILADLLEEAVGTFSAIASAKKIELTLRQSDPNLKINVDKLGFARVLGNLLSNALKFTARGGRASVFAYETADEVHIQVQDTGSGLEPAEVKRIFERYSRLEKHSQVAGTGLGLFVVKSVVGAHGGRIDVTSKVNEGTMFDVSFPKKPPVNERGELISLDFA